MKTMRTKTNPKRTMKKKTGIKAVALLAAFVSASIQLWAGQAQPPVVGQNSGTTRTIEGTVSGSSGQPVAKAIVLLKDAKTLQVRSYIADDQGRYHFFGLSTDVNYQLRAESNGMTSKTKTVSVFDSHKVIKVDLKLVRKLKT
jgi:hypothetical protein